MTNLQVLPTTSRTLNMLEWLAEYVAQESQGGKKAARLGWSDLSAVTRAAYPTSFQRYGIDLHDFRQIGGIRGLYHLLEHHQHYKHYFSDALVKHARDITRHEYKGRFTLGSVSIGKTTEFFLEYTPR